MISVNLTEGILQLSKKRLGVFVTKSTFPDIHQNDEVVEINNLRADIFNEVTLQRQLSMFSIINLLIIPIDKQQLIQTCLTANNIYCEKSRLSLRDIKVQYSSDILIQVMNTILLKQVFCSYKLLIYYLGQ